jgi:hypothetical protein
MKVLHYCKSYNHTKGSGFGSLEEKSIESYEVMKGLEYLSLEP